MSLEVVKNRIKTQVSLEKVVAEVVQLHKSGGQSKACCPFHDEKTPSFYIYGDHFHCFGCKQNGDVIDFAQKQQGLDFVQALRFLGQKFGISVAELDEGRASSQSLEANSRYFKAMIAAQENFSQNLHHPKNAGALEYLRKRGFSMQNIREFGFGFALNDGQALVRTLAQRGIANQEMVSYSLAGVTDQQRFYDFFRGRITIPIRDPQGRIIAFGARTMQDEAGPKYLNSKETSVFLKSNTLFGFDRARVAMRKKHRAVLVEGYMDVLQTWQHGLDEVVACLGTALTANHLRLLRPATTEVVLLYDGDNAGKKANLNTVKTALEVPEISVKVAVLPDGEDPDSFLRKFGAEKLNEVLRESRDLFDYAALQKIRGCPPSRISHLIKTEFFPWLEKITDGVTRSVLMARIGELAGVKVESLLEQLMPGDVKRYSSREGRDHRSTDVESGRGGSPAGAKDGGGAVSAVEDPVGFEILGNLLFLSPDDQEALAVLKAMIGEMRWSSDSDTLARLFISSLDAGEAPRKIRLEVVLGSISENGVALVRRLLVKEKAFQLTDRIQRLQSLQITINLNKLRELRANLKQQLQMLASPSSPSGAEHSREILGEIQRINGEISIMEQKQRTSP